MSEAMFYTTAGDDAVRVEIPDREDDLALTNEWLDLIRKVVNQRAMKRIYARNLFARNPHLRKPAQTRQTQEMPQ